MPIVNRRTTHPIGPKNRGANRSARTAIDRLAPAAAEQNNNALSVDGYPILLYRRYRAGSGLTCTCSQGLSIQPAPTPTSTFKNLESGKSAVLPSGDTTVDDQEITIRVARYGARALDPSSTTRSSSDLPQGDEVNNSADIDDPFVENLTQQTLEAAGLTDDNYDASLLLGTASLGCGVCMGTGYVGGYSPVGAWRVVLDAQTPWSILDIGVDQQQHPNTLTSTGIHGRTQFEITVPIGATSVDCIKLWNNKVQVPNGWRLDLWSGNEWQDAAQYLADYATGQPVTMRLNVDTGLTFTHLEIQMRVPTTPIYAEWPSLSETQNPALPENFDSVQVFLSPYLADVRVGDVIAEPVYNRQWMLTNVVGRRDRERRIVAPWEASCRLVQNYEYQYLLYVPTSLHTFTRVQPHPLRATVDPYVPYPSGYTSKVR